MSIDADRGVFTANGPASTVGVKVTVGALTETVDVEVAARPSIGAETQIGTDAAGYNSLAAAVKANGSTVHAINTVGTTVKYFRSTDYGLTWGAATVLGTGISLLERPIAADGNNVWATYVRNFVSITDTIGPRDVGEIWMSRSTNDGVSFAAEQRISDAGAKSLRHSIAGHGNLVACVWMDYRNGSSVDPKGPWELYFNYSTDAGATWQASDIRLVQGVAGTPMAGAGRPSIDVVGDEIFVAWMDERDKNPGTTIEGGTVLAYSHEIYFKRGVISGGVITWDADKRVTNNPTTYSGRPGIVALADGTILIAYDERISGADNELAVVRSTDNGVTWSAIQRLSNSSGVSTHGFLAKSIFSNRVYCVWHDTRSGVANSYLRMSTNSGEDWGVERLVTAGPTTDIPQVVESLAELTWPWAGYLCITYGRSSRIQARRLAHGLAGNF